MEYLDLNEKTKEISKPVRLKNKGIHNEIRKDQCEIEAERKHTLLNGFFSLQ